MLDGATRMGSVDAKKLTAQVAARHGLLIREDDPAMALVTMSEIVLEQALKNAEVGLRGILSEAEEGQKRSLRVVDIADAPTVIRFFVGRLSCADADGNDLLVGLHLVSKVGNANAEGLWVVVGTMAGALLRAERAG